jgi:hypothetical protein
MFAANAIIVKPGQQMTWLLRFRHAEGMIRNRIMPSWSAARCYKKFQGSVPSFIGYRVGSAFPQSTMEPT